MCCLSLGCLSNKVMSSHGLSPVDEQTWILFVGPRFLFLCGHLSEQTRGPHLTFLMPVQGPVSKDSHILWYWDFWGSQFSP